MSRSSREEMFQSPICFFSLEQYQLTSYKHIQGKGSLRILFGLVSMITLATFFPGLFLPSFSCSLDLVPVSMDNRSSLPETQTAPLRSAPEATMVYRGQGRSEKWENPLILPQDILQNLWSALVCTPLAHYLLPDIFHSFKSFGEGASVILSYAQRWISLFHV